MRNRLFACLTLLCCVTFASRAIEPPASPANEPHARARAICETSAVVPGEVANLGITFTIQKSWHLYWNGLSDSGMPIQIKPVDVPLGCQWQAAIWPAPHRHEPAEGILDHIYEDRVTVILPVLIPASAAVGSTLEFRFNLEWLVCQEACVIETAGVLVTVPVARTATPGPDAPLFAQTRLTAPILPTPDMPTAAPVEVRWQDEAAIVRFPGVKLLEFYPAADSSRPSDLLADGRGEAETLSIRLRPREGDNALRLVGMLMARTKDDKNVYYWVAADRALPARTGNDHGPAERVPASK